MTSSKAAHAGAGDDGRRRAAPRRLNQGENGPGGQPAVSRAVDDAPAGAGVSGMAPATSKPEGAAAWPQRVVAHAREYPYLWSACGITAGTRDTLGGRRPAPAAGSPVP